MNQKPKVDFTFSTALPDDVVAAVKLKVALHATPDASSGCWVWSKRIDASGYARTNIRDRKVRAGRASFAAHKGVIPRGMEILHSCDNRKCVNPDHLSIGTKRDNAIEREQRNRGRWRNHTPTSKPRARFKPSSSQAEGR